MTLGRDLSSIGTDESLSVWQSTKAFSCLVVVKRRKEQKTTTQRAAAASEWLVFSLAARRHEKRRTVGICVLCMCMSNADHGL